MARGLKLDSVLDRTTEAPGSQVYVKASSGAILSLSSFLSGLQSLSAMELLPFFAKNAEVTDLAGKKWTYEEVRKEFETLFAPYAKKNATFYIETTLADTRNSFVATVVWQNALLASEQRAWIHRMTVALVPKEDDWEIVSIHVAVVEPS